MPLTYFPASPGTGRKVAIDQITEGSDTLDVQAIKIILGAEGAKDCVVDSGQQLSANSIPAVLASDHSPVPTGKKTVFVPVTLTVSATAYHANDCIGGKQTLSSAVRTSGGTGRLKAIILRDKDAQKPGLSVVIFDSDPTAATLTDHSAPALSTDITKVICPLEIPTSAWSDFGDDAFAAVLVDLPVKAASGTSLYASFQVTTLPDFTNTDALSVIYVIEQD